MFQVVESFNHPQQLTIFRRLFGYDKNWDTLSQHLLQNGGMILTWGNSKLVTSSVGNALIVHWLTHRSAISRALLTDLTSLAISHRLSYVQWRSSIGDMENVKRYADIGARLVAHDAHDFYWLAQTGLN
jgi:hypothetical protein